MVAIALGTNAATMLIATGTSIVTLRSRTARAKPVQTGHAEYRMTGTVITKLAQFIRKIAQW